MHFQRFQAFGLCLSQLLASVQYLLHSPFSTGSVWLLKAGVNVGATFVTLC